MALIAIVALLAVPASAQRRRAVAPGAPLSIEFVDVGSDEGFLTSTTRDAWLNVGTIAKRDPRSHGARVAKQFGVRVVRPGSVLSGSVRVTARLASWDGRAKVRLDGRPLTITPLLIDSHAVVGSVVVHRLEIEVPESVAPGPLAAPIVWEVVPN
ncbi:MAG TPA: hypothetical protein VGS96_06175 [Thermoanaerobaculia bacterium]|jgi:hypothetical protein|nr:hypothetical protein [Thermoanaerobaculia bacterium]